MSIHQEAIVQAVTSFYKTLTQFPYLSPSAIATPPPSGWNSSEARSLLQREGKSDAVVDLLNHLPYLTNDALHIHYDTVAIDWRVAAAAGGDRAPGTQQRVRNALSISQTLQEAGLEPTLQAIPGHVVALTRATSNYGRWLLIDVDGGTVTNYSLLGEPNSLQITDDEYEAGTGWKRHETMPVADFFAAWEAKLTSLAWIPLPGDADLRTGEIHTPRVANDAEHEVRYINSSSLSHSYDMKSETDLDLLGACCCLPCIWLGRP